MRILRLLPLGHRLRNPGEALGDVVGWLAASWVVYAIVRWVAL